MYSLLEDSFLESDLHVIEIEIEFFFFGKNTKFNFFLSKILTNFLIFSLSKSSGKKDNTSDKPSRLESIRIMILEMIWKLLFGSDGETPISRFITVNWIFSFIRSDLDRLTVTTALKILGSLLILRPNFLNKFRQVHG